MTRNVFLLFLILLITLYQAIAFDFVNDGHDAIVIVNKTVNDFKVLSNLFKNSSKSQEEIIEKLDDTYRNLQPYVSKKHFRRYKNHISDEMFNTVKLVSDQFDLFLAMIHGDKDEIITTAPKIMNELSNIDLNKVHLFDENNIINERAGKCDLEKGSGSSVYQYTYQLYNNVILPIEIQALLMKEFFWRFKKIHEKGEDYKSDIEDEEKKLNDRISKSAMKIRKVLESFNSTSHYLTKCNLRSKDNSTSFSPIFQEYYLGKYFMNHGEVGKTYEVPHQNEKDDTWDSIFCMRFGNENEYGEDGRKCTGSVTDCHPIPYDIMAICLKSDYGNPDRYGVITPGFINSDGNLTVVSRPCKSGLKEHLTKNLFNKRNCSYSLCTCEDGASNIDRYIDLHDVISDVDDNMIVTGVQFVKKDHVMHIQIQQGLLLKHGAIDPSTVDWKSVDYYDPSESSDFVEDVDYFKVKTGQNSICLDTISLKNETINKYVLTGFRFKITDDENQAVVLEIQVTEANLKKGELIPANSIWLSYDEPSGDCLNIQHHESPQTAFSLLDVTSHPPMPLAGAGLFKYKNENVLPKHNIVGLQLVTYDILKNL